MNKKPQKIKKPTKPKVKQKFNHKKLTEMIFARAEKEGLSVDDLSQIIDTLPSILKAMQLGVEPDETTKRSASKWLNSLYEDFLIV
jgi:transcriptional regulator NrdR family protein